MKKSKKLFKKRIAPNLDLESALELLHERTNCFDDVGKTFVLIQGFAGEAIPWLQVHGDDNGLCGLFM